MKSNVIRLPINLPVASLIWKDFTEKEFGEYDNPHICFKNVQFIPGPTLWK